MLCSDKSLVKVFSQLVIYGFDTLQTFIAIICISMCVVICVMDMILDSYIVYIHLPVSQCIDNIYSGTEYILSMVNEGCSYTKCATGGVVCEVFSYRQLQPSVLSFTETYITIAILILIGNAIYHFIGCISTRNAGIPSQ